MSTKAKPIPDGYHSITPYLIVKGGTAALDYYKKAFGAVELFRLPGPEGAIGHAEIQIGSSRIMLADECPQMGARSPQAIGGSPVGIMLYVEDVDTVFPRAIAAGGTVKSPVEDKFYGDRMGSLEDPFGHLWHVGTHKEDVAPEELARRAAALGGGEKK